MTENMMSTEDTFTPDVTLRRNDGQHRYELHVGGTLAVQSFYRDLPGHIDFTHTETGKDFEGKGLGKVLAHFALDDVVATGKRIVPHCPFIAGYLRKHEGYGQFVDWPDAPATNGSGA
ncbi:N-acetyltransferase [Arthrobacter sp. AFG7.2]|jgi:predicted GNAT family acetyltransferase|uniref:GNAT family N-acetyltransferase n=1 Tax=Arthrobacter sp. AFG7.2 TaxID=1688693 RepID=UPI000C9EAF65|nr:GNAT family N-acetyltransferase [Arthrobacter sp. AFG7.2]PNI07024.1 N-acetyltransferase [Arthrobacter sp. AFG7.2]